MTKISRAAAEREMDQTAPEMTPEQLAEFLQEQIDINKEWYSLFLANGRQEAADSTQAHIDDMQARLDAMQSPDNATLHARAAQVQADLTQPLSAEAAEAVTDELAEIAGELAKDGDALTDTPESRAANVGLPAKASRFVVRRAEKKEVKPWDLDADKKRNRNFKLSSPKHM